MRIAAGYFWHFLHQTLRGCFLLFGFVFSVAVNLYAQSGESARIYHLEGKEFTLTLHGEQTVFSSEMVRGEGINLERSGTVHTGPGTFLEIQFVPSRTVVKLSENTSLIYNGIDENGRFMDLGLLYGRVLVVSGSAVNSAGIRSMVIRSGGISTRIEEADVGVDYYLESGSASLRPLCRVYVFRGCAEIFPYGRGGTSAYFGGAQSMVLEARECLSLDISSSYTFTEKSALSRDITNYWSAHYFSGSPPQSIPDPVMAGALPEFSAFDGSASGLPQAKDTAITYVPVDHAGSGQNQPATINNRGKSICLAVGLVLTVGAIAAQGVFHNQYVNQGDKKLRDLFVFTYPVLGTGLITTMVGILYNPSSLRK